MDITLQWIAIVGSTVPLLTLAGSAAAFVVRQFLDASDRRRRQFFELMQFIDSDKPIASKVAAIYELRQFPEHRDFVIRFCTDQQANVSGPAGSLLAKEMELTRSFFAKD